MEPNQQFNRWYKEVRKQEYPNDSLNLARNIWDMSKC